MTVAEPSRSGPQRRLPRPSRQRPSPLSFPLLLALVSALPFGARVFAQTDGGDGFSLVENHAAVMLLIEPESGRIVAANAAADAYYGYRSGVLETMNIKDVNAFEPEAVDEERERAATEERSYFIFPHRHADGSVHAVEVYSSPVRTPDGDLLLSIIHDITGKAVAPDDVAEYQARLTALAETRANQLSRTRGVVAFVAAALAVAIVAMVALAHAVSVRRRATLHAEAALAERTNLYRELQHRVKNSLSTIAALVAIETARAAGEEARTALSAIGARIGTVASLYRILHESGSIGKVDAARYLEAVARSAHDACSASCADIELVLDLAPLPLDARQASALGLVLNELLANAYKHAFAAGASGSIKVSFGDSASGRRELSVLTDGKPFPPDFDPAAAKGFGLRMVGEFARQLHGELVLADGPAPGFVLRYSA
ncbi:MAG: sensor histidine kinase [Spirochaetia bacterium]|nr:sensor histidine kinase [Spirochaetia bacterium]